ncbi:MAG: type IV pilin-like G/H family protein [Thermosynechococcaceae cyanobacterium]
MTQQPASIPPVSQKKSVPVVVWVLGGCGCLTFGVFVIGVLAAITLPSFLNQIGKARASEAKSSLGVINRAQQSFQLEKGAFAISINDLDATVSSEFYDYQIVPQADSKKSAIATATPTEPELRSYTGFAFMLGSTPTDSTFIQGICESDTPSQTPPAAPAAPRSATEPVQCPPGSSLIE